jgi:hypothetical protein
LHAYFLPRHYAISIPVGLLVLLASGVGIFLARVMIASGQKKKAT